MYYDYAIPHIELTAAMAFYGVDMYDGKILSSPNPGNIAVGTITGFVVFPNISDQPRGARQYYTIEYTNEYDEKGNQLFTLEETLKLNAVSPRSFDKEVLKVSSNSAQSVTLESENGLSFRINKRTDEVTVIDPDGSTTSLITNQRDYKDFIFEFLK
jgi:hypothetical protein